ncbi:MAG: ATP-binding protein [Eubacteriales bacterium]|nr:ATP-binding protein [Christensenellaceae bacterium]MDD7245600.1 ATP-binding protein [Christensenellaceae bacterium]MDY2751179.1 ATP-binding protein [Eubacteriales bacterium]
MRELSLHILDIVENSVKAGASLIKVDVVAENGMITVTIDDDGRGMSEEFLRTVTDPFTTTRTTRKVGMGLPLFKMAAETAGGKFDIQSTEGKGTRVTASFEKDNIDRAPLGDLVSTIVSELGDDAPDFVWTYRVDGREFVFDTRELRRQLDGVPMDSPEIVLFVRDLLTENFDIVNGGTIL